MENTVNNKPDENPSLTSKMSGTSSETDFPPQNIVIWMMMSVAVGLLTIYTMVNWISNKLTQEVENGKKTEEQFSQQQKTTTDNSSNQADSKQDTTNCENILSHRNLLTPKKSTLTTEKLPDYNTLQNVDTLSRCDENHQQYKISQESELICETYKVTGGKSNDTVERLDIDRQSVCEGVECQKCQRNGQATAVHMEQGFEEMKDTVERFDTGGRQIHADVESMECTKCQSNGQATSVHMEQGFEETKDTVERFDTDGRQIHADAESMECTKCQSNGQATSVHMGPGFSGNLSLSSEDSGESKKLAADTKVLESIVTNDDNSDIPSCRSTATLQNYNPSHNMPVTVNYLQTKCFTCNAEMPKTNVGLTCSVMHLTDSDKPQSITDCPQLPNNTTCAKREDEFPTENRIDSPENQPPSTINCMKTTVKSLSCDIPVSNDLPETNFSLQIHSSEWNKPKENLQATFDTTFGLHDSLNSRGIKDNSITESERILPLEGFATENIDLFCTVQPLGTNNKPFTKAASDTLNYLTNYHTPQETTDGSILSKNTTEDEFMFPQDNEMATEIQASNSPKEKINLETPRSRFRRSIQDDPVLSKSLDSQMESLKKGCKLLETKPLKSSLRSAGSEGSLVNLKEKKFVHFPPDIRHIRTVFKYHSFDETCYDFDADASECDEKRRTQSFNN